MALRRLYSSKALVVRCIKDTQLFPVRGLRSTISSFEEAKLKAQSERFDWDRVLTEGEKCVGQTQGLIGLKSINNYDETNWSDHMTRLENSEHPVHKTASILFQEGHENINKTWSLIVLLMSKTAGHSEGTPSEEVDSLGLLKRQRTLADCVELTLYGHDIHRDGVLNMQHQKYAGMDLSPESDLIFGNKIAILAGDMLFGSSAQQVGKLKHHTANILLCTAASDVANSHFIGDRDIQNNPLPTDPAQKLKEQKLNPAKFNEIPVDQIDNTKPFTLHDVMGSAENEWKLRHTLGGGTLIGKSCQAALMLANHSDELQKEAYFFGKHLYLGWRASKDLEIFLSNETPEKFSLISAPILFHLEEDHSLYDEIKKGLESVDNVDYEKVHKMVRNGPGLEKTRELLNKNNLIATTLLHKFPQSEARMALENIIHALKK